MYRRIKELRTEKNLSQKAVASYLGVALPTYAAYESGKHKIRTHVLIKLAGIYETTTDYILELSDNKES